MIEILPTTTLPFSELGSGMYGLSLADASEFVVTIGNEYIVRWDDVEYTCVCQVYDIGSNFPILSIGNAILIADAMGAPEELAFLPDTGEPFFIGISQHPNKDATFLTNESGNYHSLNIYLNGRNVLFGQKVENFQMVADGVYLRSIDNVPFVLEVGKTYLVSWDGIEYETTAIPANTGTYDMVGIGNQILVGGQNTGEPFGIAYNPSTGYGNFYALTDSDWHRVAICEAVAVGGVILKDYNGEPQTYANVEKVKLNCSDGTQKIFTEGEPTTGTIELDFSGGDMVATVNKGELWNKVNIPKPSTLVPENIAKDVAVAGIVGTYKDFGFGEISTEAAMNNLLTAKNVGKVYLYTGESTETYINGDIYVVEEVDE